MGSRASNVHQELPQTPAATAGTPQSFALDPLAPLCLARGGVRGGDDHNTVHGRSAERNNRTLIGGGSPYLPRWPAPPLGGPGAPKVWFDGSVSAGSDSHDVVIIRLREVRPSNGRVSQPRCETLLSFSADRLRRDRRARCELSCAPQHRHRHAPSPRKIHAAAIFD